MALGQGPEVGIAFKWTTMHDGAWLFTAIEPGSII